MSVIKEIMQIFLLVMSLFWVAAGIAYFKEIEFFGSFICFFNSFVCAYFIYVIKTLENTDCSE